MTDLRRVACCGVRELWGLRGLTATQLKEFERQGRGNGDDATFRDMCECSAACKASKAAAKTAYQTTTKAEKAAARAAGLSYVPTRMEGGFGCIMATATDEQKSEKTNLLKLGFKTVSRFYNPNTNNWVTLFIKICTAEDTPRDTVRKQPQLVAKPLKTANPPLPVRR